ncbi:MAG: ferrous iron transport protein B [Planctomycetaceae bacterium]|nr:ferrous iron transport protein B [Planctomycetaceae bacterium]
MREITVALAGNPNAGKTTVFNALTGSRQHVGNYPGVTVEKKEGTVERNGVKYRIVDLPGTYSLSANSPEEVVARNFLVMDKPDLVIQVVDASNLERNLYLATQIMELGLPLVIALNMYDVAKIRGIEYNLELLQTLLKTPIVPTVGNKSQGMDDLLTAVAAAAGKPAPEYQKISYPKELDKPVADIDAALSGADRELADRYPPQWLATRLFENDPDVASHIKDKGLLDRVDSLRQTFEKEHDDLPEVRVAEAKYGWISGLCAEATKTTPESRTDISDSIDSIVLHRVLGLPIFLILMYLMFQLVFTLGDPPMGWIEDAFGSLGNYVARLWPKSADSPLRDLLVDGIIGGVGGVLVLLPNIILLVLAIAFLEGTGYMARAAFIMDRLMHKIGLHGKSFIPMLLGFGCTVPAIMGTRTLENRRDRLATILVLPFMSCGARLPIYALIIPAFFPGHLQAWMLWLIYIIGIVFAIVGAKILRSTLFKGESVPFVMELPPYRMPTFRAVMNLMWDRAGEYVKKAGTIILGVSILLWAMTAYPKKPEYDQDYESQREVVQTSYIEGATAVGSTLGIDAEDVVAWTENEDMLADAHSAYWETEPGFAEAAAAYEENKAQLMERSSGLAMFAEAVEQIDEIDEQFAEATEELEEDSHDFRVAFNLREQSLAGLNLSPSLMEAVQVYRDEVRASRQEMGEEIDNAEAAEDLAYSISGRIGTTLEPIFRPVGFDWRIVTAIIGSFAAKEVFVAQMGIVYSVGEADEDSDTLRDKLQQNYNALQAFCMMLWALLSVPCVATIAVAKRETGGWTYAIGMMIGFTLIAYFACLIVYQVGSALGIGL